MKNAGNNILLQAVGDIGPARADPASIFRCVAGTLKQGDISFCQLEINLSNRGVGDKGREIARDPEIAAAIKKAGFNVVSFAGNHCLEAGTDSFYDTIDNLRKQGLPVIGVGRDIKEARKPMILNSRNTRIAFLGYNSIVNKGHAAETDSPGCAPLRARTLYEPIEPAQPGTPARAHTYPYKEDMGALKEDIRQAKTQADVVVVSIHAGIHMTPSVIAEYQKDYAHAAIDTGADLVLQHHAHILKGIEVYAGRAIFYGLGNFAIELHFMTKEWAETPSVREERKALNPDWNPPYPDYPSFPFPPDSRKTIIARCVIADKSVRKISFLPTYINKGGEPEILHAKDKRFAEVCNYMAAISRDQGLGTKYTIDGDEVIVSTA